MMNGNGIVTRRSRHGFDETVSRLVAMIEQKGAKIFTIIDHAGEATAAGLSMRATKVLVFGSPKAGTPLMIAAPSLAIDLPLKILVAENEDGTVSMVCNTAEYVANRHGLVLAQSAALGAGDSLTAALAQS
jgi:uncharacterized protein (DUF302 family)